MRPVPICGRRGTEIHEPEGVYAAGEPGRQTPPDGWSRDKTRNETGANRSRLSRAVRQELSCDP